MMARLVVAAVLLLAACQVPGNGPHGCSNVQIDWVDFIEVGTTQYVAGTGPAAPIKESDLGAVVAHVKFKVAGNVCDPGYRPKDGDAAFLDRGTPIYSVVGRPTTEALAAFRDGRRETYKAQPASG